MPTPKPTDHLSIPLRVPTVHINGTAREHLLEPIEIAISAIFAAERALGETSPNARDYYPQGEDAFREARDQHASRLARLESVRAELNVIAESVDASR